VANPEQSFEHRPGLREWIDGASRFFRPIHGNLDQSHPVLMERCDADLVVCDVGEIAEPDAVTVDALARLTLTAQRLGRRVMLRRACEDLEGLVDLMGLGDFKTKFGAELDQRKYRWVRSRYRWLTSMRDLAAKSLQWHQALRGRVVRWGSSARL
jgi:hypothetical protein